MSLFQSKYWEKISYPSISLPTCIYIWQFLQISNYFHKHRTKCVIHVQSSFKNLILPARCHLKKSWMYVVLYIYILSLKCIPEKLTCICHHSYMFITIINTCICTDIYCIPEDICTGWVTLYTLYANDKRIKILHLLMCII